MSTKKNGRIDSFGLVKHVDSVYGEIRTGQHAGGWFKSPIRPLPRSMSSDERRRLLFAINLLISDNE